MVVVIREMYYDYSTSFIWRHNQLCKRGILFDYRGKAKEQEFIHLFKTSPWKGRAISGLFQRVVVGFQVKQFAEKTGELVRAFCI